MNHKPNKGLLRFTVLFAALLILPFLFVAQAKADMQHYPVVKLRSLDKITARSETFEARVGATVKFGPLFIKVQACRKSDPIDEPESAAFLQIWEIGSEDEAQWVFSGWMFASSPALSPMDHSVYDVWVLDCLSDQAPEKKSDELPSEAIKPAPQEEIIEEPVDSEGAE